MSVSLPRAAAAEFLGTAGLLCAVVGSGVMAESLTGDAALALLANCIATGAALFALIVIFGPVSGAHFNPAVTLVLLSRGAVKAPRALVFLIVQMIGAIFGVMLAHAMFGIDLLQAGAKERTGAGQWLGEAAATFGLIMTIIGVTAARPAAAPAAIALYIVAAYWFTSSTSFANPAVTIARALTDSFAGIRAADVPMFILSQGAGAVLGAFAGHFLFRPGSSIDRDDERTA
jgi:glycerol uptake facilitator-like aquaporin